MCLATHMRHPFYSRECLFFFGVTMLADERDAKKILTAYPLENWRRPPGRQHATRMNIGDWCLRLELRTHSGARDKKRKRMLAWSVRVFLMLTASSISSHSNLLFFSAFNPWDIHPTTLKIIKIKNILTREASHARDLHLSMVFVKKRFLVSSKVQVFLLKLQNVGLGYADVFLHQSVCCLQSFHLLLKVRHRCTND